MRGTTMCGGTSTAKAVKDFTANVLCRKFVGRHCELSTRCSGWTADFFVGACREQPERPTATSNSTTTWRMLSSMAGMRLLVCLPELRRVMKIDLAARTLLRRINDARIEGPGVHVQAHGPLLELARIHHPMHRLQRIDRAGMRRVHQFRVCRLQFAAARLQVLEHKPEVLHPQAPDGHGHPAVLVAMIVHRAGLSDVPADRNQLIERRLVDEVASVVLPVPAQVGGERVGSDRVRGQKPSDCVDAVERRSREAPQLARELVDCAGSLNGRWLRHGVHSCGEYSRPGCGADTAVRHSPALRRLGPMVSAPLQAPSKS